LSPKYSIVIPGYNESARIAATLERVLCYVQAQGWDAEIIFVNDGSRDNTAAIVRGFAQRTARVQVVENPGNRGKGYSVRNGMRQAAGEILLFTDADLSSPIEEAPKLFAALAGGADVAIGSRWLRSDVQTQRQPWYRQLFGRLFNVVLRIVLGLNYADTQCGFKAFSRRAAQKIFACQKIERWGFDAELLFLAKKFHFKVAEIPVAWAHSSGTRMNYFRDGIRMVWEMLKVRWYDYKREYERC
jgi:glycosyltransferase involved in cell wall biosynthesis